MPPFILDANTIRERVFQKPTRVEFGLLVAVMVVAGAFSMINFNDIRFAAVDYNVFIDAANGDYTGYFYAPWALPIFKVLSFLPRFISYFIWNFINVLMLMLALRIFGGNKWVAMLSFQIFYCLYYGQIVGLLAGATALFWWMLEEKRFIAAGLLLTIMGIKPQLGVPMGLALLLLVDLTWWNRFKVGVISLVPAALSLLLYPTFLQDVYAASLIAPLNDFGNISLWRYIGPLALILWIPTLILPMSKGRRLVAILTTTALSIPYFQQTDLLLLFALPIGWAGVFGHIGWIQRDIGWFALRLPIIVPLVVYFWMLIEPIWNIIQKLRGQSSTLQDAIETT